MGQGLGKNSPVVLTFGKSNYEALIDRHGQWMRWRQAKKCPCITYPSMHPDIHCKLCGGRGELYDVQKTITTVVIVGVLDYSGIIQLPEENENSILVKVYDVDGKVYTLARKSGRFVELNETPPQKGTYFSCVLTDNIEKTIDSAETESLGDNCYRVKGIQTIKTGIDELYYTGTPDILSIGKIIDGAGEEYTANEIRLDTFYIAPKVAQEENPDTGEIIETKIPITEPITVENVVYVPPFVFALLSQNLSKTDGQAVVEAQGDAVCSFPYNCDVAEGDVLTVLSGTTTEKNVQAKTEFDYDTLPSFFVSEIVSIIGLNDNKEKMEYVQGKDFILSGANRIKWISENQPFPGDAFSVVYKTYPSYRVVKDIPQLRTSENQRLPKKVVVKYMASYSDKTNINSQRRLGREQD